MNRYSGTGRRRTTSDIVITPALREYLRAFDAYLKACADGDTREARAARGLKAAALNRIERGGN